MGQEQASLACGDERGTAIVRTTQAMTRKSCFPPVVDERTRVLILGSLPGEASLAAGEYYAHPRNRFWELAGGALGVDLRGLAYAERLAALLAHRVGLWDVVAEARREGSLDSAIRDETPNDLAALADSLPALRAIAFNGGKARATGRAQLGKAHRPLRLIDLPSSSPAYAAMPFAEKARRWTVIGGIAAGRDSSE